MKACTSCGELKPRDAFYQTKSRGYTYPTARCIPCHNAYSKRRHTERHTTDEMYRVARLLRGVKYRCERDSLPFDLDAEWITEKRAAGFCEVTGLPFDGEISEIHSRPWGFSLDRTDPSKGYTKDNVKAVVWIYNRAKGCGSHKDVLRLCHALMYPQVDSNDRK